MKTSSVATLAAIALAGFAGASPASLASPAGAHTQPAAEGSIARGRYLVAIGGCHDCHTPGYLQSEGKAPTDAWLTGQSLGFKGPWGTTYPANLRLTVQSLSEQQWLVFARAQKRPPMPWFNLKAMSDADLIDMYRFIRSLGPKGDPAPAAVPPGGRVTTPYIVFEPQNLPKGAPRQPVTSNTTAMQEVVIRARREGGGYVARNNIAPLIKSP